MTWRALPVIHLPARTMLPVELLADALQRVWPWHIPAEYGAIYTCAHATGASESAFAGAFNVLATGFAAAVTAPRYDLYRSLAGRRSHTQITALDWDRDSHRWLSTFSWGPFTPPETPVEPSAS